MTSRGIVAEGIWKKFRRGEVHDSLRDLIPAVARKVLGRGTKRSELGESDFWAVRDVSFGVEAGQALGIIGPNGAGKSTILKILSGIMRPDRGQVQIRGQLRALIEVSAGFHPDLTGRENVFLNGAILGMTTDEIAGKLDRIVEFSGLEAFLDTPVKRYSSGMLARLGFSVAAHMDPEVLIVDEILSVGDLAFQKKCYAYMGSLAESGIAVVFVSHNMSAVARLCPRTMVLHEGKVHFMGQTDAAQQAYYSLLEGRGQGTTAREGDIVLHNVEVLDRDGKDRRIFQSGESCRIRALVRVRKAFPRFSMGLSLSRPSGEEVFHTTAERLDGSKLDVNAHESVELVTDLQLNLAGGSYRLYVQCHDYSCVQSEICRFQAGELQVQHTPKYGGIAFLRPSLSLAKLPEPAVRVGR